MARAFGKLLSVIIIAIGLLVMSGWLLNQELLKTVNPNLIIMVFNTAACFFLVAVAILLPESRPVLRQTGHRFIGIFIVIFAAVTFLQDILHTDFGIDQLFSKVTVGDYNPNPGRMAPQTSICFMLCGWTLILLHHRRKRWVNVVTQALTLFVMMLAIIGIAASAVRLELLYDWYRYGRMAVPTAACFLMLSTALWISWYHQEARAGAYLEKQEKRISVTGIIIIAFVALSAGMSGFGILANQMEHMLELSLKEAHKNHSQLVNNEIDLSLSGMVPINTRLLLKRYLIAFNNNPGDAEAQAIIKKDMEAFLDTKTFLAASIYSKSGQLVTQVGNFTQDPDMTIPLKSSDPKVQLQLLWKNGGILRARIDTEQDGNKIGTAVVERRLHYMDQLLSEKDLLGETGETRICYALTAQTMQCLPSRSHSTFPVEPRIRGDYVTSMHYALQGENGIRIGRDYMDHQVVSAYGPLGDFGPGIVVKIDAAEFYGPIREKLQYAIGLVLLVSTAGVFVQSLQLVPLVRTLVKSEERVKSIMINVADGIIAVNQQGHIESVNPALCEMFGYRMEELVGKDAAILLPKRMHALEHQGMDGFLRSKEAQIVGKGSLELPAQHKDGHEFTILLTISALQLDEERVFVGSIRDITEHRRLEKLKTEFISTVSHELRTPLTSIRGSLGLMKAGVAGDMSAKAKEMTEIAHKNCERLILLINDILDIDKIESGQMRFDLKQENANYLVQQAVEANTAYGEKFGVRFAIEVLEIPAMIHVDANRFIQVLSNLLSNAAKFSNAEDVVSVRIVRETGQVRIFVTDKGPGIPQEFQSRVFGKFAQADGSLSREKSGTGLGLNISKQIIEHMGGSIGFTSEIDRETTFWVAMKETTTQSHDTEWEEAVEYLSTDDFYFLPRILHAEDDYDFCRIIAHSLQGRAIIHAAATVADTEKLLRSNVYDLLILDIALPDGSGLRLLDQIKENNQHTKVMILSAREVDEKTRKKVEFALVKSRVSEDKIIEHILKIVRKEPGFRPHKDS